MVIGNITWNLLDTSALGERLIIFCTKEFACAIMKKICEEEIIELGNIEFPEVEQLLSRIDLTVLPQDIPPSEYSLLENIINL